MRILVGDRHAEEGHKAVAQEVLNSALVSMHCLGHRPDYALHEKICLLLAETLGERSKAGHVYEQYGCSATLTLHGITQ